MLIKFKNDFQLDRNLFYTLYDCTPEEFIEKWKDDEIRIDLKDKLVVSASSSSLERTPICLHTIYKFDETRSISAELIYSGHIAFIVIQNKNEKFVFYKDDECHPVTLNELFAYDGDIIYLAKENGFKEEDIYKTITCAMQPYEFGYSIDKDDIIVLEGL